MKSPLDRFFRAVGMTFAVGMILFALFIMISGVVT